MPAEPVKYIGDKLVVGPLDYSFLPAVPSIPGSSILNGPVWIGAGGPQLPIANCMIGPGLHPVTLNVAGISNFIGNINLTGVVNRIALTNASGATIKSGISIKQALSASLGLSTKAAVQITSGPKVCNANITTPRIDAAYGKFITCQATLGIFAQVSAPFKLFDIPHPSKEGHRLIHSCLEGPEIGVYYRGRLKGSNYIDLPDYWKKLIDVETITVNLTPHGNYQELYYEISDWGTRIKVLNNSGSSIDCSYTVYAERIDVDKLIIEKKVD